MSNWLAHPLEELANLGESLKNWTNSAQQPSTTTDWGWKPRMDVCENNKTYQIILELPGFQKDDLDVQVNGRFLSIKGNRPETPVHRESQTKFHRRERYSGGEFHRAVALPEGIDGSSIQAKFHGGVLTLTIPKKGGKTTQHYSLLGREEHVSRRTVIEAEERERKRRMEENDPMLSKSKALFGRMGTVIEEEQERARRLNEIEEEMEAASDESRKLSTKAERQERERRIKDTKGEQQRKQLAKKVSALVKKAGIKPSGLNKCVSRKLTQDLEEKERKDRTGDKKKQMQAMNTAKRVSVMVLASKGVKGLKKTKLPETKGTSGSVPVKSQNKNSFKIKIGNGGVERANNPSFKATANLEENERKRRMSDKKGQMDAKNLAKKVSGLVLKSGRKPTAAIKSAAEEKERDRRLKDKKGQMDAKKNAKKVSEMIKKGGVPQSPVHQAKQPSKFSQLKVHPHKMSIKPTKASPTAALEDKERDRRVKDKAGQLAAKKNAKKVSDMIKKGGVPQSPVHQTKQPSKFSQLKVHPRMMSIKPIKASPTAALEDKERERRVKDKVGQLQAKKNAKKVSDMIKKGGVKLNPVPRTKQPSKFSQMKVHPHKSSSSAKPISKVSPTAALEDKERDRRVKDKAGQMDAKKNAKKVSDMIKKGGVKLHPVPAAKQPSKFSQMKVHPHKSSSSAKPIKSTKASPIAALEDKERDRRVKDKAGQLQAKKNAKKVSDLIVKSGVQPAKVHQPKSHSHKNHSHGHGHRNHHGHGNNKQHLAQLEETERNRRLKDKKGQMDAKKNAKLVSGLILKSGIKQTPAFTPAKRFERLLKKPSQATLLADNEKNRRIRDKRGQTEAKKNAGMVSDILIMSGIKPIAALQTKPMQSTFKPNFKASQAVAQEEKERDRRMKDKRGQMEAKKNAKKVSDLVMKSGKKPASGGSLGHAKKSAIPLRRNPCAALEEKERDRRVKDKRGQMEAKKLAKKVSDMVCKAGKRPVGNQHQSHLRLTGTVEEQERQRRIKDKAGQAEAKKNALKVSGLLKANFKTIHLNPHPLKRSSSQKFYKVPALQEIQAEEKERKRRVTDTRGQSNAKKIAKQISAFIKASGGRDNLLRSLEEKERDRRLHDTKGEAMHKKNAKKIAQIIGSATH
ncbi:hypothetical protein SAMD00019534_063630 [Acytostelium subglobosum LB1]|uniref:hypothetical protein n=1 Tax=Acytostelium subglobosum LB1 TaxID=1410327 RepID=UPI000644BE79|nr:hypothetical protein SAMD00019534_063630 [Acytostelium subglobosum LB1]GAM23188.1 hypothetical protein SAMD00019534_063630 [Acytostelium subglobosum LB1]|eukprot:XP_012753637.1 hypothetical protein SAMD00019534_063630 [Acytostelium subglobosum LB1]